jgi:hypothetical protein
MTAWRPAPIRQDEISRDNDSQKHGPGSQPASVTEIAGQPAAQTRSIPRSVGDAIRRLFREVKEALTGKSPVPEPKPRRKRTSGETGRAFRMLVRKIVRRTARMPAVFPIDGFLWGTFDSFNPYWDCQDAIENEYCADHHYQEQNLSLH